MYIYPMGNNKIIFVLFGVFFYFGNFSSNAQNGVINTKNNLIQPAFLKSGDTVAIVAPSGVIKNREAEINRAKQLLKSWNLHVKVGEHVFAQANHFAGTDAQRCADLQAALDDPTVSAIWCARGGYGTVRILDLLDFTKFKSKPKWLIGYSDITALHNQIHNQGVASIHGIMCVSLTNDVAFTDASVTTLKKALFGETLQYTLPNVNYNKVGEATGQLVGGNLTMLQTMLGSITSVDTTNKIIFIEEIGEYKYHIDRLLQSLKRAGYFENCKGVLVGDLTKLRKNTTKWGSSIEQLILDVLTDYNFPIAFGMPAGHEADNRALFLGKTLKMTVGTDKTTLVFE